MFCEPKECKILCSLQSFSTHKKLGSVQRSVTTVESPKVDSSRTLYFCTVDLFQSGGANETLLFMNLVIQNRELETFSRTERLKLPSRPSTGQRAKVALNELPSDHTRIPNPKRMRSWNLQNSTSTPRAGPPTADENVHISKGPYR